MKVLLVGGGKTLYFLCRKFTSSGHDVIIVDSDRDECVSLSRQLTATVVAGDGSDSRILDEAGVRGADVVLAITSNDQDNLVICQLAMRTFGVRRAMALANDPENATVFRDLGLDAFSTTEIIGSLIEQHAAIDQVRNLLPVGEGKVNVTEVSVDTGSPVAGKLLKDIELPGNALVAVIIRENETIVPRGGSSIIAGDRVVLITLPENHGKVIEAFTGERA
ncbi:MAG: NAD-binding protein [Planctomycetes bacterium]|nr:NAD-binding protein [Planctomycetota bacterium]